MAQRYISSKWVKTKPLLKSEEIRQYVPDTRRMNKKNVLDMLHQYRMVYIKPVHGTFGKGVMKLQQKHNNGKTIFTYQANTTVHRFSTFEGMYQSIRKRIGTKQYIVQKGIHMLKFNKRSFDLRIMVQKNRQKEWETTGIIARVAHPKKIVTNYHNGGTPTDARVVLSPYLKSDDKLAYIRKLYILGEKVGHQYQRSFPDFKELGIDVGLDASLKPWIFEVNTRPDRYIFNKLKDKSMFRKIIRFARTYSKSS